jgi:GDP-D-mannose dehydratase
MHDMYKYAHNYGIVAIDSVLCTHSMILRQPQNIKRQGTVAATRLDITLRLL